jgi:hypothetical protein
VPNRPVFAGAHTKLEPARKLAGGFKPVKVHIRKADDLHRFFRAKNPALSMGETHQESSC